MRLVSGRYFLTMINWSEISWIFIGHGLLVHWLGPQLNLMAFDFFLLILGMPFFLGSLNLTSEVLFATARNFRHWIMRILAIYILGWLFIISILILSSWFDSYPNWPLNRAPDLDALIAWFFLIHLMLLGFPWMKVDHSALSLQKNSENFSKTFLGVLVFLGGLMGFIYVSPALVFVFLATTVLFLRYRSGNFFQNLSARHRFRFFVMGLMLYWFVGVMGAVLSAQFGKGSILFEKDVPARIGFFSQNAGSGDTKKKLLSISDELEELASHQRVVRGRIEARQNGDDELYSLLVPRLLTSDQLIQIVSAMQSQCRAGYPIGLLGVICHDSTLARRHDYQWDSLGLSESEREALVASDQPLSLVLAYVSLLSISEVKRSAHQRDQIRMIEVNPDPMVKGYLGVFRKVEGVSRGEPRLNPRAIPFRVFVYPEILETGKRF